MDSSNEERVWLNVSMPSSLVKAVKHRAIDERRKPREIVEEALRLHFGVGREPGCDASSPAR